MRSSKSQLIETLRHALSLRLNEERFLAISYGNLATELIGLALMNTYIHGNKRPRFLELLLLTVPILRSIYLRIPGTSSLKFPKFPVIKPQFRRRLLLRLKPPT